MTSKQQYHERRAAGLCTKCAAPLNESKSSTRCVTCYEKFKASKEKSKNEKKSEGLCLGCGSASPAGNSNYCHDCRQKNTLQKRVSDDAKTVIYKPENANCKICNAVVNTRGTVCQICLAKATFSKNDAITRYGAKCNDCEETKLSNLRIASINIEKAMELRGNDLYRTICFSTTAPADYRVICHNCYWKACTSYVIKFRQLLESRYSHANNDITDIDYEVMNEAESDDSV